MHGATKRDWGDQMAREGVEARTSALAAAKVAAEEEAKRTHLTPPVEDGWSGAAAINAATLSRRALSGVARALDQGRLEEAKALGTLAASLACIPERPADRVDGDDVVEALLDEDKTLLLVAADDGEPLHPARARYLRAVLDEGMELGKGPLKAAQVRAARTMLDLGQALGEAGLPTRGRRRQERWRNWSLRPRGMSRTRTRRRTSGRRSPEPLSAPVARPPCSGAEGRVAMLWRKCDRCKAIR